MFRISWDPLLEPLNVDKAGLVSAIGPVATGEVPPWVLALVDAVFFGLECS
ncbi:hypothetical protein JCM18918_2032 [Cutibacterium acnes JCM 18918]|nr:hypothetical protein JCM18918_2032 [Cutibacterium acnes JCM 18918]